MKGTVANSMLFFCTKNILEVEWWNVTLSSQKPLVCVENVLCKQCSRSGMLKMAMGGGGGTLRAAVSPVASSLNAGYGGGDVGDRVSSA